jgi:hypothetical protein
MARSVKRRRRVVKMINVFRLKPFAFIAFDVYPVIGRYAMKSQLDMYKERQAELLKDYDGKIIALKDGECLGAFDSKLDAYRAMVAEGLKEGEYMIILCAEGDSEYTSYFANWFFGQPVHA